MCLEHSIGTNRKEVEIYDRRKESIIQRNAGDR